MPFFQDKVVLITGSSAGLGLAIAEAFATAGAHVVMCARNEATLTKASEQVRQSMPSADQRLLAIPTDITNQGQTEHLFQEVKDEFGKLDVLVNNAGRSSRGRLQDIDSEQMRDLLELNLISLVRCTHLALPLLLASRGHLVNIGSLAAKSAARWMGAYATTKFAVAAYSQQLRLELGPEGLHVLLVCPGPITREKTREYDAENLPKGSNKPGAGVKVAHLHAEQVAKDIVNACKKGKLELVYPAKARLLFALQQLSPKWGDWLLSRFS